MSFPGVKLILKFVLFVLSSWFLVHFLAVFGAFLALAYPLWWFLAPRKIPCLWCQIRKSKECVLLHPFLNGGMILVFTLISFGLVFAESKVLFKMGFPPTPKTATFAIPAKGQYRLGEIFPMKIEIAGIKVPINAIQADLGFDPQKLEVVKISTEDSFANIFIQKEVNNEVGYARLTGGLPNPGFFADKGTFGTVYFKGKNSGVVKVEFLPSSMVLANDGRGTNVLKELTTVSYLILPEKISQEEEEMQENIIPKSAVLGEKAEPTEGLTQMRFYEEERILGAQVDKEIKRERKLNLSRTFFELLERIDGTILTFWGEIL